MKVKELFEAAPAGGIDELPAAVAALFAGKPKTYSNGANSGDIKGAQYNKKLAELGFTEMTMDGKKELASVGPKLDLRTKWKKVHTEKDDTFGNEVYYKLIDSPELVIVRSYSDPYMKFCKDLFVGKPAK